MREMRRVSGQDQSREWLGLEALVAAENDMKEIVGHDYILSKFHGPIVGFGHIFGGGRLKRLASENGLIFKWTS